MPPSRSGDTSPPPFSPTALSGIPGAPVKRIRSPTDVATFKQSASHRSLVGFISHLASAVQGVANDRRPEIRECSPAVSRVVELLDTIEKWIDDIPLEDMKTTRFGNKSARIWHQQLQDAAVSTLVPTLLISPAGTALDFGTKQAAVVAEVSGYLLDSFGNATRLDYGSGHELHFLLMLYVLAQRGAFQFSSPTSEVTAAACEITADHQGLVLHCFTRYISLMRHLQSHYRLEPAGSHGVWGLDDYHHLPFIFGAAQLSVSATVDPSPKYVPPAITPKAPPEECSPGCVTDAGTMKRYKDVYMYFSMIAWIQEFKKGPFHEHSSVLYNVSGVASWSKIVVGMFRMFDGEVLSKINITQHLLFSESFPWPGEHTVIVDDDATKACP